jgi:membrane-bound lytic murein transglycosylase B
MTLSGIGRPVWLFVGILGVLGEANAQDYDAGAVAAARNAFIQSMVERHGFESGELSAMLESATIEPRILAAISRPAERVVPWYEYREIFLDPGRIEAGVSFWADNEASVASAAERFGVDPEIVVAIIGIESRFGERMGSYRVLDALATLAFAFPPRSAFFTSELEAFLLLARDEHVDPTSVVGSYAGAMGAGQFIPSSYRAYAVDGDRDGQRDLWESWDDIIASVANYLSEHGWKRGEPIAQPARRSASFTGAEPSNALEISDTVGGLASSGYVFDSSLDAATPASVFSFERDESTLDYWIGYRNFHVITRYNRSTKYALAAVQLSEAIRSAYEGRFAQVVSQ